MLQKLRGNTQGFTLIELMIVIAIIGILAAIAIPNFISYRNKSFCSAAESDANAISGAIADYFAIPSHLNTPETTSASTTWLGVSMSGQGEAQNTVEVDGVDPNANITITVADMSTRCPIEYRDASSHWTHGAVSAGSEAVFTKTIQLNN